MFRFAHPDYFWLLWFLPAAVFFFAWSSFRRRRRLVRFGDLSLLASLASEVSPLRHFTRFVFWFVGLLFLIFALARPQLGSKLREVTVRGLEMMLVVDVSNSMLAEDFSPSRLERTKNSIARLLETLEQDRVGLVVFAGDAYVQLPITADYTTALSFVRHISPTMVSRQGTAIGAAIDLSIGAFSSKSDDTDTGGRVIVLITDGENHQDDVMAAAQRAADRGIRIYTIGIGTPEGAPIRIGDDFLRDEAGGMVVSKLNEPDLQRIALATGGAYIRSTPQSLGLSEIISKIGEVEKKEFSAQLFDRYDEQFAPFLWAALLCFLISWALSDRKNRFLARFRF